MTTIGSQVPQAQTSEIFKPVGKSELGKDDFMTLFITQLQHQDPMKPMEPNEMASQLAEFSNMEATMKMADNIEQLLEYQTSQNNLQLLTLLYQYVRVYGNGLAVSEGETGAGEFILDQDADTVVAEIRDSAGRLVKIMDMGSRALGSHAIEWDATDMMDKEVQDGAYTFDIKAYTAAGQEVGVDYRSSGKVTGVDYETGTARLVLDHHIPAEVASVIGVI